MNEYDIKLTKFKYFCQRKTKMTKDPQHTTDGKNTDIILNIVQTI